MKKHWLAALILCVCLMGAWGVHVLVADDAGQNPGTAYFEVEGVDADPQAGPRTGTGSFSGPLSGGYVNFDMPLDGDHRCFQMTIANSGDTDIQVDVCGTVYTVSAHTTGNIRSTDKWRPGTYTVGFSAKTAGQSMSGSVICTRYATLEETET